MSSSPTLPGTIPGLLRRGSPVVSATDHTSRHDQQWLYESGRRGVVLEAVYGSVVIFWGIEEQDSYAEPYTPDEIDCVALDLTDATGRAHAAWWLAGGRPDSLFSWTPVGQLGSSLAGWTADGLRIDKPSPPVPRASVRTSRVGHWKWETTRTWRGADYLLDLNPDDPRLLPDGSRCVDAEALRLVCLHVAGLEG